ncbi:alpha/beta hydrolase [Gordonia sp. NB41Y]|uniref:alpha/beta fold hydrolase n=1 Tax=Gordonia sp. NB41Y TaxID=875808 RepID=UPI00034BB9AF|nr:alpha/beta hydrolase [Gordonia sp. NB41Y]KOY48897.1 hydrolase [Gordonia sp. NB41Y]WLP92076.1 alpha/beta hydrolase [Gordonia sp. NB41Y]
MALREVEFTSSNGRDTIYGWIYEPVRPARGIIQLVHGLGEHSRRYLRLITELLDAGFVVAADDHAGHGKTAMTSGVWADAGHGADRVVVDDERTLRDAVRELHPELPYIVFGHSWGSMIARGLVGGDSEPVAGLILCGIAAGIGGIEHVLDREALAAEPDPEAPAGETYVVSVFDGFISRYGPGAGPTAWVARDPEVVADHAIDPLNNFGAPMSVQFLQGFVDLYDEVNAEDWYPSVRADLPVLILAGDADPVTNYGEGAYHVANRLIETGHPDVRTRVYSGFRHEVHNEPEIRDDVAGEIIAFADRCVDAG